ncbi:MAG: fimbrillin family protein [Candidatus Cryptobacteroides sp.]
MKTIKIIGTIAAAGISLAIVSCNKMENKNLTNDSQVSARIIASIQTKASGTAWADGDAIGITTSGNTKKDGTEYTNIKYTTTDGGMTFEGEPIYFQNKSDVTFAAYYPFTGPENAVPGTLGVIEAETIAANQTSAAQPKIDFLYAETTANITLPTVEFLGPNAFKHKMCMMTFNFVQGNDVTLADLTKYTVKGIVLQGGFNVTNGEAKANGTPSNLEMAVSGGADPSFTAPSIILFPQTIGTGNFDIEVELNGITYSATLAIPGGATALAEGLNYKYNIKISKTGISVGEAEIADWTEALGADVDATM